jgi:transposase-like protein
VSPARAGGITLQSALPRLVLCAFTGVALVLIGGVFAPWWVSSDRSLARVAGVIYREMQRGEALDRRDERLRGCREAKERITAEVLAGRLSLAEAAEAFRAVNETLQGGDDAWVDPYRYADDEEAVCRTVITWARHRTTDDPERQAAVVARLEEELQQLHQAGAGGGL